MDAKINFAKFKRTELHFLKVRMGEVNFTMKSLQKDFAVGVEEKIFIKELKIRIFMIRYRIIFMIGFSVFIVYAGAIALKTILPDVVDDSALLGVGGTLAGAVIGGSFTLLGSIWVNARQQRAVWNVRRKNEIYSPLYDELVNIHTNILPQNPYPAYIVFKKESQTYVPHPQFVVWRQIKSDTRHLETPQSLDRQMERLEKAVQDYLEVRKAINEEIQNIVAAVLAENNYRTQSVKVIGDLIGSDILNGRKSDIYDKITDLLPNMMLEESDAQKVSSEIYNRCNQDLKIMEVRIKHENWMKIQKQTIEMLRLLIQQALLQCKG